jgi:hypothetical protein
VLKDTDSNKSPGVDGLPYEFYKAVWELVGGDVLQIIQGQCDKEEMIESNRNGATRLASKVSSVPTIDELIIIIYIIYVEPLLLLIEKMTTGLRMGTMVQRVEAYCDDINLE